MRLSLLVIAAAQALRPRGAAKDPARRRETTGVYGFEGQLGKTAYGYLQRLGALQPSGLKQPVALLKTKLERRALNGVLGSDFQGALEKRREVYVADTSKREETGMMAGHWAVESGAPLRAVCENYDGAGPPFGLQRCVYGEVLTGDDAAFDALCAAADYVACVAVAGRADAVAAALRRSCEGSLVVEVPSAPEPHAASWSHLKGFRRGGLMVEDVAAVLAAGCCALGPTAHHRLYVSGDAGDAETSPLELMGFLLDACPEATGVDELVPGGPDEKWATW